MRTTSSARALHIALLLRNYKHACVGVCWANMFSARCWRRRKEVVIALLPYDDSPSPAICGLRFFHFHLTRPAGRSVGAGKKCIAIILRIMKSGHAALGEQQPPCHILRVHPFHIYSKLQPLSSGNNTKMYMLLFMSLKI